MKPRLPRNYHEPIAASFYTRKAGRHSSRKDKLTDEHATADIAEGLASALGPSDDLAEGCVSSGIRTEGLCDDSPADGDTDE